MRVLHFSIQDDHVHLIIEVDAPLALVRGVQGLAIRCARAVNRTGQRRGAVWGDRYYSRALKTPLEVRQAIVYVLMNFKTHRPWERRAFDPCSSAAWFDGFDPAPTRPTGAAPTRQPQTWLASIGWRRHGLIGWDEAPAGVTPAVRSVQALPLVVKRRVWSGPT